MHSAVAPDTDVSRFCPSPLPGIHKFVRRSRECLFRRGVTSERPPHRIGQPHRERRMSKLAIRLLTLAMYATALAAAPMVTSSNAAAETSKAVKKKKKIQTGSGGE